MKTKCPICKGDDLSRETIFSESFSANPGVITTIICNECGYWWVK